MVDHSQDGSKAAKGTTKYTGYGTMFCGSVAAAAIGGPLGLAFAATVIAGGQSAINLVDDSPDTGSSPAP